MRIFLSMLVTAVGVVGLCAAQPISAGQTVRDLTVRDGDQILVGRMHVPATTARRPLVLVAPEWWGRNTYVERRAAELAALGYVSVTVDFYGEEASLDFPTAVRRSTPYYQAPERFVRRLDAFAITAAAAPEVDPTRIAGVGFCFGGSAVLQWARTGTMAKAVVAFHPGLKTSQPATRTPLARILVAHGGADPFVPASDVAAFISEMTTVHADWQMAVYGRAVHAFTNPTAGTFVTNVPPELPFAKAVAHDPTAEAASMTAMAAFLKETLK